MQTQKLVYTMLEIQFRSANYMLVVRICKNFKQNKPFWWQCSRRKLYVTVREVNIARFKTNFYLQLYFQHNKTVFFNTIDIHIAIHKKLRRMTEEQAVFGQSALRDFKIRSSTALNTFNNFRIIMTNISNNIRIA